MLIYRPIRALSLILALLLMGGCALAEDVENLPVEPQVEEQALLLAAGEDLPEEDADVPLDERLQALSDAMNQELLHHDNMLSVDLAESFGVACYPDHGTTFRRLFECADYALYQAKKRGDHKYVIFE